VSLDRRLEEAAELVSTDERPATLIRLEDVRPGRSAATYADVVDGTLLALATHARPAATRAVLGSTAMTVLRHATSPMLVRRLTTR
jgi:nucleotide-binding universal stress UspA family protein